MSMASSCSLPSTTGRSYRRPSNSRRQVWLILGLLRLEADVTTDDDQPHAIRPHIHGHPWQTTYLELRPINRWQSGGVHIAVDVVPRSIHASARLTRGSSTRFGLTRHRGAAPLVGRLGCVGPGSITEMRTPCLRSP